MANESKRELILQAIVSALQAISKDDGYWNTVEPENVRRRVESFQNLRPADFPVLVVQSGQDINVESISGGLIVQEWAIRIYGVIQSDDPNEGDTEIERLLKDVIMAFGIDWTFGSNVRNTTITSMRTDLGVIGFPNYGMLDLELTVQYSTEVSDP